MELTTFWFRNDRWHICLYWLFRRKHTYLKLQPVCGMARVFLNNITVIICLMILDACLIFMIEMTHESISFDWENTLKSHRYVGVPFDRVEADGSSLDWRCEVIPNLCVRIVVSFKDPSSIQHLPADAICSVGDVEFLDTLIILGSSLGDDSHPIFKVQGADSNPLVDMIGTSTPCSIAI